MSNSKLPAEFDIDGLSLEELEPTKSEKLMTCPKCDLQQPKADQCSGCGVYVNKVQTSSPEKSNLNITSVKEK